MNFGFVKCSCVTPSIKIADCTHNSDQIVPQISYAAQAGVSLVVFPELCITGYTCADLFLQRFLISQAENSIESILQKTKIYSTIAVIGAPVSIDGAIYDCAVVIYQGDILGIVPKINITAEENRYFASGKGIRKKIHYAGQETLFGSDLVFECKKLGDFKFGVEIGEDAFAPNTPSTKLVLDGRASIIVNPAAGIEYVGESENRRKTISALSDRLSCAYLYCSAGDGESSTDCVYSSHRIICETGRVVAEECDFDEGVTCTDIDVQKICHKRMKNHHFSMPTNTDDIETVCFDMLVRQSKLDRKFTTNPFIPEDKTELEKKCDEILAIQSRSLAVRMNNTSIKDLVIGVSGGLDSTLALIVCVKAMDILGLDHKNIHAVSMPCFGTTQRTKLNAEKLSALYNVDFKTIDITNTVRSHFADICHSENDHSATYENAQARIRTLVLMDLANKCGGLVVGTGDLSELALGWATYNGDHMSMYAVNASVPKTVVKAIVERQSQLTDGHLSAVLRDILSTPVSPELLPPSGDGRISQVTEDLVGPYELHDFFMFCFLKHGFTPEKIFYIAVKAFENVYDRYTIKKWMQKFFIRFFTQQFKRSCMPDGPRVGSVSLSPRGDFKMPSDVEVKLWVDRINEL